MQVGFCGGQAHLSLGEERWQCANVGEGVNTLGLSGACRAQSLGAVFSSSLSDLTLFSFKVLSCASCLGQTCLLHTAGLAPG